MKNIPRLLFAHLPTPIEPMKNLSTYLDGPQLWIKRDDQTGLAFGGNKTRKLEFLLAEAIANGAKTLVTAGAQQSNHCRQTAAAACKFGLDCVLVLSTNELNSPNKDRSGNLILDDLLGAKIVWTTYERRSEILDETFTRLWNQGRRPYLIPIGGSNATGALGYTQAMRELLEQTGESSGISFPSLIVVASSSGGTQAGMVAGQQVFGLKTKILGISIDEPEEILRFRVASLASQVCDVLDEPHQINPASVLVNDEYLGAGYGMMGEAEHEAIQVFARKEGILLDPVYTGRAAAGLIDLVRRKTFQKDQVILFWHTGGTPALFADQYKSRLNSPRFSEKDA